MESSLGWIDLSPAALRRLRQELDPDTEGVVDEMGVGAIHSGYADHFFPGTSVLHTRPRYVFFTCWNYLCLGNANGGAVEAKEKAELWVKNQLLKALERGIIGKLVERPAQPVDFVYWTALRTWGFYRGPGRNTLLSRWGDFEVSRVRASQDDDDHVTEESRASFLIPPPPRYWLQPRPREALTFDLTADEADFLQKRLESLPACILSTAASSAGKRPPTGAVPWEDAVIQAAARELRESDRLERARRASSLAWIVRATYAALVERRRNETSASSALAQVSDTQYYRQELRKLFGRGENFATDALNLELALLKEDLPRLPETFLALLKHVQGRIKKVTRLADLDRQLLDEETMEKFSNEEARRKDNRARLPDTACGAERRELFNEETVRVTGIDYRWRVIKKLLGDLYFGLRRRRA